MDGPLRRRKVSPLFALLLLVMCSICSSLIAADLSVVPLFDAERSELVNNWGGAWNAGTMRSLVAQSECVHSGRRALCLELGPTSAGQVHYAQCLASGFGRTPQHHQTRDLACFERLSFYVTNATGAPLDGVLQVKDYRDSLDHCALFRFALPEAAQWRAVEIPLRLDAPGWSTEGQPDLTRVVTLDFGFRPQAALAGGRVYLDELALTEPGGPLDVATASITKLVEWLARRQWDGLWAARSRAHGMVPIHSYQSSDTGLNSTAAVLWMLPSAVRHGWVASDEADRYVALLVQTVDRLLDRSKYVPPRNVDWVTLEPSLLPEESSVDAAFLALAMHQYKSLATTPAALRQAIDRAQERFDFSAFACPAGWHMAYRYSTRSSREGLVEWVYDGYTNEGNLVSLAAHLAHRRHVPIATHWNTTRRARIHLTGLEQSPVVHAAKEFRAPFAQALLNLFVDVRQRGPDIYPDKGLATNPWENFVLYEQSVMKRLEKLGRPGLVQPDAGDDGTLANYQQFSLYEDFGQNDLFMPWSAAFPLLAGAPGAEQSLRFLLNHGLHGPLGLADSARWRTGEPRPYAVTARHDFWNTALATMALLEWLDGEARLSKSFAAVPEVQAALDRVFPPAAGSPAVTPRLTNVPRARM